MKSAYVTYVASLLLFGSNGIVASQIGLASGQIVLMRTLMGALALGAVLLLARRGMSFLHNRRSLACLVLSGAALGASWLFLYEAYRLVGVGVASLAYYCGPVIVMALSPLLFGERLTKQKVMGFAAVLCGVALVSSRALQSGGDVRGLVFGGVAAVLFAVMVIFNKKAVGIGGLEGSAVQMTSAFLVSAVALGAQGGLSFAIAPGDWAPLLMLGLVNTALGFYWYFSAMGKLSVQSVALCGYLEPLAAVVLSVLLLGEAAGPAQMLGAALVIGGALFGECVGGRRAPRAARPAFAPRGVRISSGFGGVSR